jgi:threonine/homoserine/homoserine lactone efflux protein
MIDPSTLALFLLAVLALLLSPGPNMAFVLSHGIAHGAGGGLAAALGIGAADIILTLGAVTGITAMVAAWPPAFDVIRYLGAVYLLWLAAKAVRSSGAVDVSGGGYADSGRIFRRAMLNSLLNPKALLFYLVFLPQFVDTARGDVLVQFAALGCTLAVVGVLFHAALGMFSGRIGKLVNRSPAAARLQNRLLGGVLAALAMRLLLLERPS